MIASLESARGTIATGCVRVAEAFGWLNSVDGQIVNGFLTSRDAAANWRGYRFELLLAMGVAAACIVALALLPMHPSAPAQIYQPGDFPTASSAKPLSKAILDDRPIIHEVAEGFLEELQLGQLAQDHAANPRVKAFARRLIHEYEAAEVHLKELADKRLIALGGTDFAFLETSDRLSNLTGMEFDRSYLSYTVHNHMRILEALGVEAEVGTYLDVKAWAKRTLPMVRRNAHEAEQTLASVGR